MKKILLFIVAVLVTASVAQAQVVTINGRLLNAFSQGLFLRPVALIINAGNPSLAFNDTLLTDSMGFFSNTYSVPPGFTSGTVVAITTCGNSVRIDSAFWSPATTGVANFGNIICSSSPPPPAVGFFCGMISPLAAGDTAKIELYSMSFGTLRLDTTIYRIDTLNTGWTAYCFSALPGNYRIKAELTPGSTNAANYLSTWFGNTTNPLNALNVTIASATSVQNINIQLQTVASPPVTNISGNINGYTSSSPSILDTVEVILIEVNNGIWTPFDTIYAIDSSGNASFSAAINRLGKFSVLARLRSGNSANYVPTYYGNATTWSAADSFALSSNGASFQLQITLQTTSGTGGGGGTIGGGVFGNLPFVGSGGIAGMQIQLMDASNTILRITYTNTAGSFNLAGLPFGTYRLRVERFGLSSSVATVVIDAANPNQQNIDFTVNGSSIATSVAEEIIQIKSVYPNPATTTMHVVLSATAGNKQFVQIHDLQGRLVLEKLIDLTQGEQRVSLDVSGIRKGMYLLTLQGAQRQLQKIVIQ